MANVTPTISKIGLRDGFLVTWEGLNHTNTTGAPIMMPSWRDRSVQIVGTFDSGTVVFQGSNDGTNYVTLTDPQGNAISATSAKLEQIEEATVWVKPSISGGSGSEDVDVFLLITGREFV